MQGARVIHKESIESREGMGRGGGQDKASKLGACPVLEPTTGRRGPRKIHAEAKKALRPGRQKRQAVKGHSVHREGRNHDVM